MRNHTDITQKNFEIKSVLLHVYEAKQGSVEEIIHLEKKNQARI